MISRMTVAAIGSLLALGCATVGHAAPTRGSGDDHSASIVVKTAGLDLRTTQGASILLSRIHVAATQICGGEPSLMNVSATRSYQACFRETVDHTVASIDNPLLASLNSPSTPDVTAVATLK
ncbi:MAG TPA: UrcA family protein [Caulobacteraceae bacterium]|jgi:UrcA family protein|nr:UrcA family protein [Caulobacteraceae bacterium]